VLWEERKESDGSKYNIDILLLQPSSQGRFSCRPARNPMPALQRLIHVRCKGVVPSPADPTCFFSHTTPRYVVSAILHVSRSPFSAGHGKLAVDVIIRWYCTLAMLRVRQVIRRATGRLVVSAAYQSLIHSLTEWHTKFAKKILGRTMRMSLSLYLLRFWLIGSYVAEMYIHT